MNELMIALLACTAVGTIIGFIVGYVLGAEITSSRRDYVNNRPIEIKKIIIPEAASDDVWREDLDDPEG